MTKLISIGVLAGALFGLVAYAAQDVAIERVEVRDPVRLEAYLEANATDAQARLAALEGSLGTNPTLAVAVGALATTGTATAAIGSIGVLTVTGSMSTTGVVTIAEGKLADSTIVSADIKDGEIVNADINASAAIALTKLAAGNLGVAYITNAVPALAGGNFYIVDTTQLVFVAGAITNVIDADLTH